MGTGLQSRGGGIEPEFRLEVIDWEDEGAEKSVCRQSILIGKVGGSDFGAKTGDLDGVWAGSALMHRGIR